MTKKESHESHETHDQILARIDAQIAAERNPVLLKNLKTARREILNSKHATVDTRDGVKVGVGATVYTTDSYSGVKERKIFSIVAPRGKYASRTDLDVRLDTGDGLTYSPSNLYASAEVAAKDILRYKNERVQEVQREYDALYKRVQHLLPERTKTEVTT